VDKVSATAGPVVVGKTVTADPAHLDKDIQEAPVMLWQVPVVAVQEHQGVDRVVTPQVLGVVVLVLLSLGHQLF
jgi:hypothetical protein